MVDSGNKKIDAEVAAAMLKFLSLLPEFEFGFSDAVAISGIDARQLRNGLDRGSLRVGRKLESVGRWLFTGTDCLHLMIVGELASKAWVPVGVASSIAADIVDGMAFWGDQAFKSLSFDRVVELVAFNDGEGPKVYVHVRGDDWGFYDIDGTQLDRRNWMDVHIRIPAVGLARQLVEAITLVREESKK